MTLAERQPLAFTDIENAASNTSTKDDMMTDEGAQPVTNNPVKQNGHHVAPKQNGVADSSPHENGQVYKAKIDNIPAHLHKFLDIDNNALQPAEKFVTTNVHEPVKIKLDKTVSGSKKPFTVETMVANTVKRNPNGLALSYCDANGNTSTWTNVQYYEDILKAAKSFLKLGLEEGHGVGIVGFNSPEWFISDFGAIFAGGQAVGIYTTNSPEACQYVAENCQANIIVVEDQAQLKKILTVEDNLPHLKAIIQYKGEPTEKRPNLYSWTEFMKLGEDVDDELLIERIQRQAPNKSCTLIYTSGTTGNPKGVMLSHDNITWTAAVGGDFVNFRFDEEVLMSYLPLSHIAAQLMDIHVPAMYGATTHFAKPDALKGSLGQTLREVRPTAFMGVPRVWEKIMEKFIAVGKTAPTLKKKIGAWAKDIGLRGNKSVMNGGGRPWGWTVANMLVFRKVRAALGLDRCRCTYSGAAPISRETIEYFLSLNIPILELYGMSECSGPHTLSKPTAFRLGSVGLDMSGVETVIVDQDADGNGEICMKGRHVMMGYLNMEEKTSEALDDTGLLHSGDVGKKDSDGFLYITGRIKELIITAGGENVAPVPIEDTVKAELPIVSNCMLIGDKQKFLSLLLTLKTDVEEESGLPTHKLSAPALEWCKSIGSDATTLQDVVDHKDEKILDAIQKGIDRANEKSISRAQKIAKWSLLPRDFSVAGGELGPTLKLKRPVVTKMYEKSIEAFYEGL